MTFLDDALQAMPSAPLTALTADDDAAAAMRSAAVSWPRWPFVLGLSGLACLWYYDRKAASSVSSIPIATEPRKARGDFHVIP